MSVTAFFVEHIIAGVQACLWIGILVASYLGLPQGVNWTGKLETEWLLVVAMVLLAFIYPLGIAVDEIADSLFRIVANPLRKKMYRKSDIPDSVSVFALNLTNNSKWVTDYFSYLRTRIRICRCTCLNATLSAVALALTFLPKSKWGACLSPVATVVCLILFVAVSVSAYYAWYCMTKTLFAKAIEIHRTKR